MRAWAGGIVAAVLLGIAVAPAAAFAQQAADPPARRLPRGGPGGQAGRPAAPPDGAAPTLAEVERLFDRYVLNQAQVALGLTPEQTVAFAPELRRLQTTRRRLQRERQRLLNQVAAASRGAGPIDEGVVSEHVRALDEHRVTSEQAVRDAMAAIDQVLTVPQQARFRVFEQRIERQRLELLARARRAARGVPASPAP